MDENLKTTSRAAAIDIWKAGVDAVRPETLLARTIRRSGHRLFVGDVDFNVRKLGRVAVVGGGKAGAGMAAATEQLLGDDLREKLFGWVNVPDDCVTQLERIQLHGGRPAGVNEPTEAGLVGCREILKIVQSLTSDDLCLVLISGGGSALLPYPAPPITLAEKQHVTRFLMSAGADITELNTVRKRLSLIKGGGLARAGAAGAGATVALIISDVIGDPLNVIASGPTYPDASTNVDALAVLEKFSARDGGVADSIFEFLERTTEPNETNFTTVSNQIIGNNQVALDGAAAKARELGFAVVSLGCDNAGEANDEGRQLVVELKRLQAMRAGEPICVLSGGEPVVRLIESKRRGVGGRNQQLALAALAELIREDASIWRSLAVLSGGTDGEDGPTDAAGAIVDSIVIERTRSSRLAVGDFLERNDAYSFFEQVDGLLKTGPTHTNVMDLRVGLIIE